VGGSVEVYQHAAETLYGLLREGWSEIEERAS
jgi:hypothetical protein